MTPRPDHEVPVPFPDDPAKVRALAGGAAELVERWLAAQLQREQKFGEAVLVLELRLRRTPVRRRVPRRIPA